ncbi:hypothetical protein NE865_15835 [Phthorimaea operculella]|nr:hypothetical protein NE865_15835 [Phthorimaea operculella]
MANKVKCNSCNLIVDELLAFVQNKLDTMDEESMMRICVSAFTPEVIATSKKLLYEAVTVQKEKIKTRKGIGKEHRDIADIISFFKLVDPEKFPVFVAKELHKLPPVTFDHVDVTALLKDIVWLKSTVEHIKSSYATTEHLMQLENQVRNCVDAGKSFRETSYLNGHPNVNTRRGAYLLNQSSSEGGSSGPMGIAYVNMFANCEEEKEVEQACQRRSWGGQA